MIKTGDLQKVYTTEEVETTALNNVNVEIEAGEFVALFWTHDLENRRDLTVHMLRDSIHQTGNTSAGIRATNIPGQIAAPLLLEDGRVLAFVVDRGEPSTMTLWLSNDGGH